MAASQTIWLLRHGATEWSRNGRHTGSSDIPLLPEGEEEAKALAPRLSGQSFAQVWVSPLQRARRTCELAGLGFLFPVGQQGDVAAAGVAAITAPFGGPVAEQPDGLARGHGRAPGLRFC